MTPVRRTCNGKEEPEEEMLNPKAQNSNGRMSGHITTAVGISGNSRGPFGNPQKYISAMQPLSPPTPPEWTTTGHQHSVTLNTKFQPGSDLSGACPAPGGFLLTWGATLRGLKGCLCAGIPSTENLREPLAPLTLTLSVSSPSMPPTWRADSCEQHSEASSQGRR